MNVLSIDFDYFQNTSVKCLNENYPNGIDRNNEQSEREWQSHYAKQETANELLKVGVLEKEYNELKELLQKQNRDCPVMIANSHISIYDFICAEMEKRQCTKLWISNIDMHHDMFNENPKLDCGNWIGYIKEKYNNTRMEWIANPISREMYGLDDKPFDIIKTQITAIKQKDFDVIFLCRSDNWLPPHLDRKFTELAENIIDTFYNIKVEYSALREREYKKEISKNRRNKQNGARKKMYERE